MEKYTGRQEPPVPCTQRKAYWEMVDKLNAISQKQAVTPQCSICNGTGFRLLDGYEDECTCME